MAGSEVGLVERMTHNRSIMNYYWTTIFIGVHNSSFLMTPIRQFTFPF